MTKRTLRRRVIIRQYDFDKIKVNALSSNYGLPSALYDRAEFTPLSEDTLEKLKLVEILKGKTSPLSLTSLNLKFPALTLYQLKDYLYDERYIDWNVTIDLEGYICVQSRSNTPLSRIGWGVFEKDYESRI